MKFKEEKHVKFYLRSSDKDTSNIRAVLNYPLGRAEITTNLHISPDKWDAKKMRTKANTIHKHEGENITGRQFDKILEKIAVRLSSTYNAMIRERNGRAPSGKDVVEKYREDEAFHHTDSIFSNNDFFYHWESFTADGMSGRLIRDNGKGEAWHPETLRKHNNAKWHLEGLYPNLTLAEFSTNILSDLIEDLVNKNLKNTTIEKIIKSLKLYTKYLARKEYISPEIINELKQFRMGLKQVDQRKRIHQNNLALTRNELLQVIDVIIPTEKNYLKRAKDCLIFQCYTGLRYSDVKKLNEHHLLLDAGRWGAIDIYSTKGKKQLYIPLNKPAREIIDKYLPTYESSIDPGILPVPSNQKYNTYIKELLKLAKINDPVTIISYTGRNAIEMRGPKHDFITSHVGRKTFINILLNEGKSIEVVAALTGDSINVLYEHYRALSKDDLFDAIEGFR